MSQHSSTATAPALIGAFPGTDPTTLPVTDHVPELIRLTRREFSLITERLLMAAGCGAGAWPGARDYVLETLSQVGPGTIDLLEAALVNRDRAPWPRVALSQPAAMDADGAPLILVGNSIANALIAFLGDSPDSVFTVTGLSDVRGFEGLAVRATYHGFTLSFTPDHDLGQLKIRAARTTPDASADVVTLLRAGVECSGTQWWRVYQPSNFALSEETEVSRSHTGVSETLLHYSV
ncbi:hypothetical protein FM113_12445 [Leucobacter sp. 7(1)]|uniref:hypothetical protein n=1 Tax=Leucobacter sp. 7(1) TaxID=1255613 RepID=UPI00097EA8B5|nr:hypothetical protein [Leucobacter sp. 7(1)]SJN11603.1 hypothetical protein FM113_12445 [Leucobacter sp. 7(1)]